MIRTKEDLWIKTEPVLIPDRSLPDVAAEIRRVHALCLEWETRPNAPQMRAGWTRYFLSGYGIWGLAAALVLGQVVPALGGRGLVKLGLVLGSLLLIVTATLYALIAMGIDLNHQWKDLRTSGNPFQKHENDDLLSELDHLKVLASVDEKLLVFVAASQETKAKKMEERLSLLKGLTAFAMTTFAGFILPWSPFVKWLTESVARDPNGFKGMLWLQLLAFALVAGSVIGLGAAWRERVACTRRSLHLRRVIDQRDFLLGLDRAEPKNPSPNSSAP
jgi:hypothetical protein